MANVNNYRKGAASLYVVIFTTLLLGIITMSFIRIMLSEAGQTSNSDLSQSAYDSALAGIEDAKVALLKYHECLSTSSTAGDCVNAIAAMNATNSSEDCDIIQKILGRTGDNETTIQAGNGAGADLQQAYTCVRISEDNSDYLGQLNNNYASKTIPIRTTNVGNVKYVRVQWYTTDNDSDGTARTQPALANSASTNKVGYDYNAASAFFKNLESTKNFFPPLLVQLFQTDATFSLSDLNTNNGNNTDRGTLLLVPDSNGASNPTIHSTSAVGFTGSADLSANNPISINCNGAGTYKCSAILEIPNPYNGGTRNSGASFLRLSLPYGTIATDFSVELLDSSIAPLSFVGVQAKIDATGRANDLIRRVESRVELVDVYYPYPEYSVTLTGNSVDTLAKNFWVTVNNWATAVGDSGCDSNTPTTFCAPTAP
jgi:hypothetical protein